MTWAAVEGGAPDRPEGLTSAGPVEAGAGAAAAGGAAGARVVVEVSPVLGGGLVGRGGGIPVAGPVAAAVFCDMAKL